jgi:ElaB/YqjD/DUF883 family membrane-anchored ribosome-binding protein
MESNGRSVGAEAPTGTRLMDRASNVSDTVSEKLTDIKGYAGDVQGWVGDFARERPLMAVGCAIGLGFVIGRLVSRF